MESILTVDIGSSSMRAILYDDRGTVLHTCRKDTVPMYCPDGTRVELDAEKYVEDLLLLLRKSWKICREQNAIPVAISVTSQRSSVVPVDGAGRPLAPFIMWHDKRTAPICRELLDFESRVYTVTGLRISPVFSAVKMTWIRKNLPDIYRKTVKMLGIHDLALHTLCGRFVTDHSLASNTNLLNLKSSLWDDEMLEIFSVDRSHLCDLVPQGSICGRTSKSLQMITGISEGIPVITAGGDQQCAALGLGVTSKGKLKCTTGTGSYLVAHAESPVIDEKMRFLCKIGAIPGTYNLEAGLLTTGTVYRWFVENILGRQGGGEELEAINREILSSPAGANGVIMLPNFEGTGAPYWNPADIGMFYGLKLSTTRGDMARSILEGIVMGMDENLSLFRKKLGNISRICISGGLTKFAAYNQLQADIFGHGVTLYPNRESASLGAWISASVTLGLYGSYDEAFRVVQPAGSETVFNPEPEKTRLYRNVNEKRTRLYHVVHEVEKGEDN